MHRFFRDERGQGLALFAIVLVVVLGFSALAIDVGFMMHKRAQLQKAADAAALAGIMDVWANTSSHETGKARAIEYAIANGIEKTSAQVLTSYPGYGKLDGFLGEPIFLEVDCEATVDHFFGPVIGIGSSTIQAQAVAVKTVEWKGESLPFINLGKKPAVGGALTIWDKDNKTPDGNDSMGDREIIDDADRKFIASPVPHFQIAYSNGVDSGKGKDMSVEKMIADIWANYNSTTPKPTIYVLSLHPRVFEEQKFTVVQGHEVNLPEFKELKNKDTIKPSDLVLLEVTWNDYYKKQSNNMVLDLTVKAIHELDKVPDSYDGLGRVVSYLIK